MVRVLRGARAGARIGAHPFWDETLDYDARHRRRASSLSVPPAWVRLGIRAYRAPRANGTGTGGLGVRECRK